MKTYPSAVDKWLAAILIGTPLLVMAQGIYFCIAVNMRVGLLTIILAVFIGALITLLSLPCVYTLNDEKLTIRCGLIRYKVPLSEIRHVEKSGKLWSAPALSINRVEVITNKQNYLISPKDRDTFIADVRARITP